MGRPKTKSTSLFSTLGLLKAAGFFAVIFGVTYGVSLYLSRLSTMTLSQAYKSASVAGNYIDKTPAGKVADKLGLAADKAQEVSAKKEVLKVALLADSHTDNANLAQALKQVKADGVKTVFFLGDYSNVGTVAQLNEAKTVIDGSGIKYYSIPGDHDLWQTIGPKNFLDVFGSRYQTVSLSKAIFIMVDNSDNDRGVDSEQLSWLTAELDKLKEGDLAFILISNPLYNTANFKVMGENNENIANQKDLLLSLIRNSKVKAVIAADSHLSSQSVDPQKPSLKHITIGALTNDRNLQSPRYAHLTLYEDSTFAVKDKNLDIDTSVK